MVFWEKNVKAYMQQNNLEVGLNEIGYDIFTLLLCLK